MSKVRLSLAIGLLTALGLFGYVNVASAYSFHSGNNVTLPRKAVQDTVYAAGRTVDINSEVFGDVFCAGQNINVTGTVHGDVICAGQNVNVTGNVTGDVRLAGQTVTLGADVGGNATIGSQSFTLTSNGAVRGDLTAGTTDTTLNGQVGRDAVIGGNDVIISSTVGRNIKAQATNMTLTSTANVGGDIALTSKNDLHKARGATVAGTVMHTEPSQPEKSKATLFGFSILWLLYWLLAMLVTAIILALLFPRLLHAITDRAIPRPWKALLIGFLAGIVVPIIILLLAFSLVGLPLALILGLAWFGIFLLSGPVSGYYLGRMVLRGNRSPLLFMLVGAAILVILYFIPFVGLLVLLAAIWLGTGMILLELQRNLPRPSYARLPATDTGRPATRQSTK